MLRQVDGSSPEPVKRRSLMPSSVKHVTDELLQSLEMAHKLLVTAPARRISAISEEEQGI